MIIILQIENNNQHTNIQNDIISEISFLKQTPLPKKQLRIFLSYLRQEPVSFKYLQRKKEQVKT